MAGDISDGGSAPPPESQSQVSRLFGHAMEGIKHGASVAVKKGDEIVHSETAQKFAGQVKEAGSSALRKGHEIAQSETAHRIEGQAVTAGKEVAHDHVRKVTGVIEAGKHGDVNGVLRNGLPLASEILVGPAATALMIGKDKGGKILMDNVPAEHRDSVKKLKDATDLATSKHTLPNLIIQGAEHSGKY